MFISLKRHEREKQELVSAGSRLTDAILKGSPQGLCLIDPKDRLISQPSASLGALFHRQDFDNLSFEKLIAPLVTAKTMSVARTFVNRLFEATMAGEEMPPNPLLDVEVKLGNADGSLSTLHYSFEFNPVQIPHEPRSWLLRVTDITARVQQLRELDDLRSQVQTQGELLRGILRGGPARFAQFLDRTDASMTAINEVLKKPARQADAFRSKLDETLAEVDRVRHDAAAFKLTGLATAARSLEDALQELRSRGSLSGSDFLPLAVKLDSLYGQFALLRLLTSESGEEEESEPRVEARRSAAEGAPLRVGRLMAQAGSLDSTLASLTELVAHEYRKTVVLECSGLEHVPPGYQSTIKKIAIQLIRNAVMHGIETSAERRKVGKPSHGTLHLEFKRLADGNFELQFHDDGRGLDPDQVRATAVARGVVTAEAAARLRDRQAIKLIFKSRYTTLGSAANAVPHGSGMAMVRRYVHEAGGKVALASLLGHETRFRIMLPSLGALDLPAAADSADDAAEQVA